MLHIKPTDEADLAALTPADLVDAVEVFSALLQINMTQGLTAPLGGPEPSF